MTTTWNIQHPVWPRPYNDWPKSANLIVGQSLGSGGKELSVRAVLFEQEGGGIPLESYYYLSSEIEFNRVLEVRAQLLVKNWAQSD